jgi:hypothetical protein
LDSPGALVGEEGACGFALSPSDLTESESFARNKVLAKLKFSYVSNRLEVD